MVGKRTQSQRQSAAQCDGCEAVTAGVRALRHYIRICPIALFIHKFTTDLTYEIYSVIMQIAYLINCQRTDDWKGMKQMKKLISLILVFACVFMCMAANAASYNDDIIVEFLDVILGEGSEASDSFFEYMYGTEAFQNSLYCYLYGDGFMLEYRDINGYSHLWNSANLTDAPISSALAIAEVLDDDYFAYFLLLFNNEGSGKLLYLPSMSEQYEHDDWYYDFESFNDAALDLYIDMFVY